MVCTLFKAIDLRWRMITNACIVAKLSQQLQITNEANPVTCLWEMMTITIPIPRLLSLGFMMGMQELQLQISFGRTSTGQF